MGAASKNRFWREPWEFVCWKSHGFGGAFLRPVGIEHEEAPISGGHVVIHGEDSALLMRR